MADRPRLVHLAAYGGPYPGSFVPMVSRLLHAAEDLGWAAEVVFPEEAELHPWLHGMRADGARVKLSPTASRVRLARWIREMVGERPGNTILHTHFTRYDLPALAAARRPARVAVAWHLHTGLYRGPLKAVPNAIKFGLFGRGTDLILAASPEIARRVAALGGPRRRLEVVGNCVDTARFPLVSEEERAKAKRRMRIDTEVPALLHFGWDWYLKDGDLFLDAVQLSGHGQGMPEGVVALIVGGGEAARSAVRRRGLETKVRVLAPTDAVRDLYAVADVFVSSSRVEGQPFAILEALSCGVPVVATDIPGHRTMAEELVAGCEIVSREPLALAAAIGEALRRSPSEAEAVRTSTRAVIAERFGVEPWTQRMIERYNRLLHAMSS